MCRLAYIIIYAIIDHARGNPPGTSEGRGTDMNDNVRAGQDRSHTVQASKT